MAKRTERYSRLRDWPEPGKRYGYLTVISRGMNDKHGHQRFWCRCDCGKKKLVRADYLQNGDNVSCGHVKRGEATTEKVLGYKCIETGEVFASSSEAAVSIGLTPMDWRKIRSAVIQGTELGTDPLTGEPLHWTRAEALKEKKIFTGRKGKVKKVVCLNTMKVFDSLVEASLEYGLDKGAVGRCCNGIRGSAGKDEDGEPLIWMWYDDWKKEFG